MKGFTINLNANKIINLLGQKHAADVNLRGWEYMRQAELEDDIESLVNKCEWVLKSFKERLSKQGLANEQQ